MIVLNDLNASIPLAGVIGEFGMGGVNDDGSSPLDMCRE